MKKLLSAFALVVLFGAGCAASNPPAASTVSSTPSAASVPNAVKNGYANVGGRHYYKVTTDPNLNTGNKVCASLGLKCIGYTDKTLNSCIAFHPDALNSSDYDGANAGFYCNGPPEQGVCGREHNSCHICPQCNTNMDCNTQAGTLYREMFVECK